MPVYPGARCYTPRLSCYTLAPPVVYPPPPCGAPAVVQPCSDLEVSEKNGYLNAALPWLTAPLPRPYRELCGVVVGSLGPPPLEPSTPAQGVVYPASRGLPRLSWFTPPLPWSSRGLPARGLARRLWFTRLLWGLRRLTRLLWFTRLWLPRLRCHTPPLVVYPASCAIPWPRARNLEHYRACR